MQIKDFKVGDTVYILIRDTGRNPAPVIQDGKVTAVGRKYVTIGKDRWGRKFMERKYNKDSFLQEKVDYGEPALLFKTKKDAEDYIEKDALVVWFCRLTTFEAERYTLEQLRAAKDALVDNKED